MPDPIVEKFAAWDRIENVQALIAQNLERGRYENARLLQHTLDSLIEQYGQPPEKDPK